MPHSVSTAGPACPCMRGMVQVAHRRCTGNEPTLALGTISVVSYPHNCLAQTLTTQCFGRCKLLIIEEKPDIAPPDIGIATAFRGVESPVIRKLRPRVYAQFAKRPQFYAGAHEPPHEGGFGPLSAPGFTQGRAMAGRGSGGEPPRLRRARRSAPNWGWAPEKRPHFYAGPIERRVRANPAARTAPGFTHPVDTVRGRKNQTVAVGDRQQKTPGYQCLSSSSTRLRSSSRGH